MDKKMGKKWTIKTAKRGSGSVNILSDGVKVIALHTEYYGEYASHINFVTFPSYRELTQSELADIADAVSFDLQAVAIEAIEERRARAPLAILTEEKKAEILAKENRKYYLSGLLEGLEENTLQLNRAERHKAEIKTFRRTPYWQQEEKRVDRTITVVQSRIEEIKKAVLAL